MIRRIQILAGVALLLGSYGLALGISKDSGSAGPFAVASVRFEQNVTGEDAEVVFEVKGGREGLAKLIVVSPTEARPPPENPARIGLDPEDSSDYSRQKRGQIR